MEHRPIDHSVEANEMILSHREEREIFNRQWALEKQERHQHNVALADNVIFHGTFFRHGVGQNSYRSLS